MFSFLREKLRMLRPMYRHAWGAAETDRAHRDWRSILIVFFIATFLITALSQYLSVLVMREKTSDVAVSQPALPETIDRPLLEKVIGEFADRQRMFDTLRFNLPSVSDPSR